MDVIEPQQLISHYDASRHPEVATKVKTTEVIMKEFLDTFDVGGTAAGG